jgi:RNA polymerase sigma factor (TIGR02999 family)
MEPTSVDQITRLLHGLREGSESAQAELMELVYPELRKQAARALRRERPNHTLQATALVNEVYLRVVAEQERVWHNRAHFFAVAAVAMREILADYARRRGSIKRGGGLRQVELEKTLAGTYQDIDLILMMDDAIEQLMQWDQRQARIVILRYFGGLTEAEVAEVLGISARTVKRDWEMARAWLGGILSKGSPDHDG